MNNQTLDLLHGLNKKPEDKELTVAESKKVKIVKRDFFQEDMYTYHSHDPLDRLRNQILN